MLPILTPPNRFSLILVVPACRCGPPLFPPVTEKGRLTLSAKTAPIVSPFPPIFSLSQTLEEGRTHFLPSCAPRILPKRDPFFSHRSTAARAGALPSQLWFCLLRPVWTRSMSIAFPDVAYPMVPSPRVKYDGDLSAPPLKSFFFFL